MTSDGNSEWIPLPGDDPESPQASAQPLARLDSLLPADAETGAATYDALRTYLGSFMDLMARHGQPLTLLSIAGDPSETLRLLGAAGGQLIGSAIARCLRQETRVHDVVGRAAVGGAHGAPAFLIVLPLMSEPAAAQFAERLLEAMTISAGDEGRSWLTLSVGVASLSLDTDSPDTLILRAREALGSAQRAGGERVWRHSDTVRRIVDHNRSDPLQE